jgi:hypothetical protein
MADERYDPFAHAVVWGEAEPETTLNAAADPPAAPVAVEPAPVEPEPDEREDAPLDEAPETEPEAPEEGESEEEAPAKPRSRHPIQPRLSELTQQRNAEREQRLAAEIARAKAEGRAEALEELLRHQGLQAPRPPEPVQDGLSRTPQGRPIRPAEDAYATTQDYHQALHTYEDALGQWHSQQAIQAYEQQRTEREATQKVLERYPDFYRVVQGSRIPINQDVGVAINASPEKPALLYHLATHPDEAASLAQVQGVQAFRAIAALELALSSPPPATETNGAGEPPKPPPLEPPPPIAPTRGTGARPPRGYDDVTTMEFFDMRNKEEMARRR